ncbi:MAG: (Fe-S)-binding protein [Desulfatiglandales bacterium]
MSNPELADLEKEITDSVQRCWKCKMCVAMCPTYEGWFTQSTAGRLMAINLYIKHGLGSLEDLSNILYSCTTCRRCQERCRAISTDCRPADVIRKARQYLVKMAEAQEKKK